MSEEKSPRERLDDERYLLLRRDMDELEKEAQKFALGMVAQLREHRIVAITALSLSAFTSVCLAIGAIF